MTVSEQIADELYGLHCDIGRLEAENRKLRELVQLLLRGIDHDAEPVEALVWSHEVEVLMCKLGIEVDA